MGHPHPRIVAATRAQFDARRAALAAGAGHVGWKIALGIDEVEALAGSEPALGHITTATVVEPGGTFAGADTVRELRVETELAVEVGPGETVAGLAVALEIVDVGRPPDGLQAIIAANVFHGAVVFGPTLPERARPRVGAPRARLLVDGAVRDEAPVTADPVATIAAIGRLLEAVGERLLPATASFAGSACHVPAAAGDAVVAEIDGLGAVDAAIAP